MSLSVVHPPRGTTTACTLDIVAVHGLNGDAIETWTHPKSNAFWLKDFLPHRVKDARILTFGYDATAAFGRSTAEVIDHAKSLLSSLIDKRDEEDEKERPIIFVAHSLGGIIVKQALLQARLEPQYKAIQEATLGILFFGTPHRGSDKATYGKVLANVAQTLSHRPPPRLMKALETNSDVLLRLTSDFKFQLPRYRVVSFYELRPMGPLASLVVERHSALLEVDAEDQVPINADHSQICKFENEDDDIFEKTWKRIERMKVGGIRDNAQPATTNQSLHLGLLRAATSGHLKTLEGLLRRGARPDVTDEQGRTCLFKAINAQRKAVVEALLQFGADVNMLNDDGWSPLHEATSEGYTDIAAILIKAGANVHLRDQKYDWPALHWAARKGRRAIAEDLMRAGADPNFSSEKDGWTALHFATCWRHKDVMLALIEGGADVNKTSHFGETPLDVAEDPESMKGPPCHEVMEILRGHVARKYLPQPSGNDFYST